MHKYVWRVLAVCLCGCFLASVALARVWLLPDYQAKQLYSHRVNGGDASTPSERPQGVDCHAYGLIPASEIGEGVSCSSQTKIMNVTCYGDCTCSPVYNKTESSCLAEGKIPGGTACMGEYYTECLCDTNLYPYTSANCSFVLGGNSCSDKSGAHYSKCTDPCEGLVDNTTDLGCEKYYAACPSKCEVGKTCVANDCSAYTLTSCPSGSVCESCIPGCGDDTPRYRVKEFKGLAFQVDSPAKGKITFTITGSNYQIDWGDGTVNTSKTHTYTKAGKYDIDVSGGVTSFSISSGLTAKPIKLYSLNLPKATKIHLEYACPTLTGTIPSLPDSLTDGTDMFFNCSKLTGEIPNLPNKLVNGANMFYKCSGLTGSVPALPDSLTYGGGMFTFCTGLNGKITKFSKNMTNGAGMFVGCKNLTGSIPTLPDSLSDGEGMFSGCGKLSGSIPNLPTSLKYGKNMFSDCSGLTGDIPPLPDSLTDGSYMFSDCSGLTGAIPPLPDSLTDGIYMFSDCSGLTGAIPPLPDSLTDGSGMFSSCRGLTGDIPPLPDSLTYGSYMFYSCSGLTGDVPELPSTIRNGSSMFAYCSGLNGRILSLQSNLRLASRMFEHCSGLIGNIPELPSAMTNGSSMFAYCSNLSGPVPKLPSSLSDGMAMFLDCTGLTGGISELPPISQASSMFSGCSQLSGVAPALPDGMGSYSGIFKGTQITNDGSWGSWAW